MTGGGYNRFGRLAAILVRSLFSLIVAAALGSSSESFDVPDQRLSFSHGQHAESVDAPTPGGHPAVQFVDASDDLDLGGFVAIDAVEGDPTLAHSTRSVARFCDYAPEIVYTVAGHSLRCSSRPRAPPANFIG